MDRNGLNSLACEIHAQAVEKGFWDVEDAMAKHIAKMHSELSEAIQEDRMGHPMLYVDDIDVLERITDPDMFDGRKPEGIAAELVDFVMMALDLFAKESYDFGFAYLNCMESVENIRYEFAERPLYEMVLLGHEAVSYAHYLSVGDCAECIPWTQVAIPCVIAFEVWLNARGVDLWQVVRLKLEYNKSRPALHGRKY